VVPADKVPPGAETARTIGSGRAPLMPEHGPFTFLHPLDDTRLQMNLMPSDKGGPAVEELRQTGKNPYDGDAAAIAAGKTIYQKWCAACHLEDGTGRIGSNLVDAEVHYPRVAADIGLFEVIYAGAAGAMQPFGDRIRQDDILKIVAFINDLKK